MYCQSKAATTSMSEERWPSRGGHLSSLMDVVAAFDWQYIWDHRGPLFDGLKVTLKLAAIGIAGAFIVGLLLGAARAYRIPVISQLAGIYVELIRNTPILVQIFLIAFGLPKISKTFQFEFFTVAWVALVIWGGAFNTENFRAGFEAVPARYREAAYALDFRTWEMIAVLAVAYLSLVWALSFLIRLLERRLALPENT